MKDVREMSADEQQEIINEAVHAGNMAYADVLQIIANKDVGEMSADELREVINEAVHAGNMANENAKCGRCGMMFEKKSRFYTEADGTDVCHGCMCKMVDDFREMVEGMMRSTYKPGDNVNCAKCGTQFILENCFLQPDQEFPEQQDWFSRDLADHDKFLCNECAKIEAFMPC